MNYYQLFKESDRFVEMIERGNHDEIMAYISKCQLEIDAEPLLVKRGNHDEIMAYITRYGLEADGEVALRKRGNAKEIKAMKKFRKL